jgi:glycosyltransferase involved in cell wall biosynthesis
MKDKKILYLGGFKLPDKNAAAHRVIANSKIFGKLGFKTILIGQTDEVIDVNLKFEGHLELNIDMYSSRYPQTLKTWIKYILTPTEIKRLCEIHNPSHIIFYNYPSIAQLRVFFFLKKRKIKWLSDTTEWYSSSDGGFFKRIVKKIDTSLRMRIVNKINDGNILISKYLFDFYGNTNNLLLPPLVDCSDSKWGFETEETAENDKKINLIYAGQFGTKKDNLVEVFRIIEELIIENNTDLSFNIVGMTREEYQENTDYKVYDFVKFHGRKSHTETISIVRNSDFVLFFRSSNRVNAAGFPTKFVEAYTCGVPVITNLSSDLTEYLKDGINGFVISDNRDKLKDKLRHIFSLNKSHIAILKLNLQDNKIFDFQKYMVATESFFNKISCK